MVNYTYCEELELMLVQFLSTLDGCTIRRERRNSDGSPSGEFELYSPRYILASKTRVFYDIYNKAGNITLPVVVAEFDGLSFDQNRMFNKQLKQGFTRDKTIWKYDQPTPVDLKITLNFYTKFMSDLYKMASNFIAFTKPYYFISWRLRELKAPFIEELRSQVLWDGSFNIDYPKTPNEDEKWLIHGTAGFTIKGWIFNNIPKGSNVITKINIDSYSVSKEDLGNVYGILENEEHDYYFKDGWPSITNIISDGKRLFTTSEKGKTQLIAGKNVLIEGRSFFNSQCTGILIQPHNYKGEDFGLTNLTVNTIRTGSVSGYSLENNIESIDENIIKLNFNNLPEDLEFNLIVYNNAGFTSVYDRYGQFLKISR